MERKNSEEKESLWIVRYENGEMGCLFGTKREAEEYAEQKGGKYIIV